MRSTGLLGKIFGGGDSSRRDRTSSDATLLCKCSGWTVRNENELVIEYRFTGALAKAAENIIQLEVTFMPFAIPGLSVVIVQRFVNILLHPDLGYPECQMHATFDALAGSGSTGFVPVRVTPAAGRSTLVNIPDQDVANRVCGLLSLGNGVNFALWDKEAPILKFSLYNDASYRAASQTLTDRLRSGA